jgi:hypothetical protein
MKKQVFFLAVIFLIKIGYGQIIKPNCNTQNDRITNALLFSIYYNNLLNVQHNVAKPLNYHHGFIVANNNDTIIGNIRLRDEDDISLIYKRAGLNIDTTIHVADIKNVRLFDADSLLNNHTYTDYVRIGKNKHELWRQVYKGNFEIYDEVYAANERPGKIGDYLMVKENDIIKYISGFWTINPKRNMIDYINQKYDKKLKPNNFNSMVEVITWLKLNA